MLRNWRSGLIVLALPRIRCVIVDKPPILDLNFPMVNWIAGQEGSYRGSLGSCLCAECFRDQA